MWLAFVDSDDWVEPDMFRTLIDAALEHGTAIAGGAPFNERTDGTWTNNFADVPSGIVSGRRCNLDVLYQTRHAWGAVWGKVYRRELFDGVRFPLASNLEDYVVMTQMYERVDRIWFCSRPLYHHRVREGSLSSGAFSREKMRAVDAAVAIRDTFVSSGADGELVAGADSLVFRMYASMLWECRRAGFDERPQILAERRGGAVLAAWRWTCHSRKRKSDLKLLAMLAAGLV